MLASWKNIKSNVLIKCKRYCCYCEKFSGNAMEVHHIKPRSEGGKDTEDNAIPLCCNCHALVASYNPNHPKGSKHTVKELKHIRDNFYEKIADIPRYVTSMSSEDHSLLEIFKQDFTAIMEYIIKTDFSSEFVSLDVGDDIENLFQKWGKKKYSFSDITLSQLKDQIFCSLEEFQHFTGPDYLHYLEDRGCLIFRNDSLEAGRKVREELQPNSYRIRCDLKRYLDRLYFMNPSH